MFCPKCGNNVEQNVKFCGKCGFELNNIDNHLFTQNIVHEEKSVIKEENESENIDNLQTNSDDSENFSNNQSIDFESNETVGPIDNSNNWNTPNSMNSFNPTFANSYVIKPKKNVGIIFVGCLFLAFLVVLGVFIVKKSNIEFYFNGDEKPSYDDSENQPTGNGKYQTVIITDNKYEGVKISTISDAHSLISNDSTSQKNKCPSSIRKIEDEIISNYGITAVNLCEMDLGFAKEISNVLKKIYNEFPGIRGYLTNLSLNNVSGLNGYIAAFMPLFPFANTNSEYPWVFKTQVLLNTTYYLNKDRLTAAIDTSTKAGHFPKNTTIYSPVAHEFGHYISFLAMIKHHYLNSVLIVNSSNVYLIENVYDDFAKGSFSLEMIKEAYNNYIRDTGSSTPLDEWRGTISKYALAKDNNGEYIYDETIAESFHDVYLNGNNAATASKYIYQVLRSKVGA